MGLGEAGERGSGKERRWWLMVTSEHREALVTVEWTKIKRCTSSRGVVERWHDGDGDLPLGTFQSFCLRLVLFIEYGTGNREM